MDIRRGDIFYVSYEDTTGSEQRSGRPAVIVSNDMNNQFSGTVEIVYLTTQPKKDLPTHVRVNSSRYESVALCEQITTISTERLGSYFGSISLSEMNNIDKALMVSLELDKEKFAKPVSEHSVEPEIPQYDDSEVVSLQQELTAVKAKYEMLQQMYNHLIGQLVSK